MDANCLSFKIDKPDGLSLAALRFPSLEEPPRAELIVCHGFSGGKENGGRIHTFAGLLNQIRINVTAFDFTGAGGSDGDFDGVSLSRQIADLNAVMDFVAIRSPLPLLLLGRSFGGSTALAAGFADARVCAFVFWSTPVNLYHTFRKFVQASDDKLAHASTADQDNPGPQKLTVVDESGSYQLDEILFRDFECHDMEQYARSIAGRPVLVVHGGQDIIVDPSEAQYLADTTAAKLHVVSEADHQFTSHTEYREQITIAWLKDVLGRKSNRLAGKAWYG